MRFRVLGPLRVRDGAGWSPIRAGQERAVLAILLAETGQLVTADRLADEIWGQHPPRTARNTIHAYVSRLRRILGPGSGATLVTRDGGYELVTEAQDLDAAVFDGLLTSGRRALAEGRLEGGAADLSRGLSLWQGAALSDVPSSPTVTAEANRLEQRRLTAVEELMAAELDLGHHAGIVDRLGLLVLEHPFRERLWADLILAMYRCGRRAEAIDAYRRARQLLASELGIEPAPHLTQLIKAVLADDASLAVTRPPSVATVHRARPAQLPADVVGFTGRDTYLRQLDALLPAGDTGSHRPVPISTISGMAGVGKTALAVHWAHRVRARFPDGQLYVNLRGYAAGPPLRPMDALAWMLSALAVGADELPSEEDEATALYRSLLADKRMLLVLDNACDADQVRPLLPGSPGCAVVITSRDRLGGLIARDGAALVTLGVLDAEECRSLLTRLLSPDRVRVEPTAVSDLIRLCGGLPLALRIAAANVLARPVATITDYVAQLDTGDRLAALRVRGDAHVDVRAAFALSYSSSPVEVRRVFRLLSLWPGPDITTPATAALAELPPAAAASLLGRLVDAHLLHEHTYGRYSFHDLIRLYAAERTAAEDSDADRRAASDRLYGYYLRGVDVAAARLYPEALRLPAAGAQPVVADTDFADHAKAAQWLEAERHNVVAAVRHTAAHGPPAVAVRLADAIRGFVAMRRHMVDWLAVAEAALGAAEAAGDLCGQAAARLSFAHLRCVQDRYQQALDHCGPALGLASRAGWQAGAAAALGMSGNAHNRLGNLLPAADHYRQSLVLYQQLDLVAGQATSVGNLGLVHWMLGRLEQAAAELADAVAVYRRAGSHSGEARTLAHLGVVFHKLGRSAEAKAVLGRALALHREVGDRQYEADTMAQHARVLGDTGEHGEALDLADAALALARDTEDRLAQTTALHARASLLDRLGRATDAVRMYEQARELARRTHDRYNETDVLIGLAAARHHASHDARHHAAALDDAQLALAIARGNGYRLLEGDARTVLAAIHLAQGNTRQAVEEARLALTIHAETGHRPGQVTTGLLLADANGEPDGEPNAARA